MTLKHQVDTLNFQQIVKKTVIDNGQESVVLK